MNVNNTLDLLLIACDSMPDARDGLKLLHDDITQAIKFDLGDEFSSVPGFELDSTFIPAPQLPYDCVYFEAVSHDGKRYGALFENYKKDVCGQMLVEAASEDSRTKGLFPIDMMFFQVGNELKLSGRTEEFKEMQLGAIIALDLMVKAIAVLNCSNVITVDSPAKTLTNKRRAKKGKAPLYTYKTLHIFTDSGVRGRGPRVGTHASPRVHLRRGHIRKLPSGTSVWVQPCVVGDKARGVVHKDYRVH